MLPKMPPKEGQIGFIFIPPFRIQGISMAGEQTVVQVPELDVVFDIGLCPRVALPTPYVALSHAHMDHIAGLPYYFSQRVFQKMGLGTCVCHADIIEDISIMMRSWVALECQQTPHRIIPLRDGEQIEIKNNIFLRAIEVSHTVPALGYVVIEKRSKLREEFHGLPQERLRELKQQGVEITKTLEIPLVAYTGDTELGPYLFRDEFALAKIVISECTFFEEDQRSRAAIGKHLHVDDITKLLEIWQAEAVVLAHTSRRTNLGVSRELMLKSVGAEQSERVHLLMDHRSNHQRYERQKAELCGAT